ncbi:MAG: MBL fold metallo-hydrolase [Selenomonadaceae bacterium]|nr:MBL fold metallo-hydrolase [Selenomonadaceae bacterium]
MILTVEVNVMNVLEENSYFFVDDDTRHGFLIDPGAQADLLMKIIAERDLTIEKILITHGHFDHIGAVNEIASALKIPVIMGKYGRAYAENPQMNCSAFYDDEIILRDVNYLDDDSEINLDVNPNFSVKILPTPGHTADGVIYYCKKKSVAFVGDTIFFGSYGRTDLPGGNEMSLIKSIKETIFALPDDTVLLCGHGSPTTVAAEKSRPWY